MNYLLWLFIVSFATAEPDLKASEEVLTPNQIYALLDDQQWTLGIEEAKRLVTAQPTSPIAYVTLGDALAHYPNEDGDVYAGFDAWMRAKELADPQSKIWKVAKERLGWALQRSGVVKLTPSSSTGQTGWSKDFSYKISATRDLDWAPRTDFMRGGVYITNIPTGEILLEITPDKGLPTIVQKYNITSGELRKITIPIDQDALQNSIDRGEYLPTDSGGNEIIDQYIQDLVQFGSQVLEEFKKTSVTLPSVEVPEGSVIQLTDTNGEHFQYATNSSQTVRGGQYLVEVSQDGVGTFGDLVIHPSLTRRSMDSVFNDVANRRPTPVNPTHPNQVQIEPVPLEVSVVSEQSVDLSTPDISVTGSSVNEVPDFNLNDMVTSRTSRLKKGLWAGAVLSAGYSIYSNRTATSHAQLAIEEKQSQGQFEDNFQGAEFWRTQYEIGTVVTSQMLIALVTTYAVNALILKPESVDVVEVNPQESL